MVYHYVLKKAMFWENGVGDLERESDGAERCECDEANGDSGFVRSYLCCKKGETSLAARKTRLPPERSRSELPSVDK